jgi:rod shape-determining protein MreD
MTTDLMKRAGLFVAFLLVHVIVLGRIHLFGCATPLLYVWFVILLPRNFPKWKGLLWSFAMGLLTDIFSNTPGLAAASLTLIGVIQPYFFEIFVPRDSVEDLKPSIRNIGPTKYAYYVSVLVFLYCLVFYSLEMFSFFEWLQWVKCIIGSTVITLALIFTFEMVRSK